MDFPVRCRCGQVEGQLASTERAGRAVCYCRDCQAFARFLGDPERILNERAGTDVVATSPRFLRITRGQDQIRCMSLSETGLLRWYTACCRTPIGNTPRDPRLSYVGLVHSCLAGSPVELDQAFGPARVAVNTASASGPVHATTWANVTVDRETPDDIEKTYKDGGRTIHEQYRKDGSHSEVTVILKNGVIVDTTGDHIDGATLKSMATAVDLDAIEAMKRPAKT